MVSDYKWIVHPYSFAKRGNREISVVHEINFHGLKSYGWFGDRKILISHDTIYGTLDDDVVKECIGIAKDKADKLNKESLILQTEIDAAISFKENQNKFFDELQKAITEALNDDFEKRMEVKDNE